MLTTTSHNTIAKHTAITGQGMVYSLDSNNYLNITVSGKRSVVSALSADDFKATASLKELSKVNAVPVDVKAKRSVVSGRIDIVKQSVQTVVINIENIEKQEYPVEVSFTGDTESGYVLGDYSVSKNYVTVKAPESTLDRISRVVAVCDLDEASSDISKKCRLVLYDKRGRKITGKNIKMSAKKVTVTASVLKEKEVEIAVDSTGNPADGYRVANVELSKDKVTVVGTASALEQLDKIEISDISIAGRKKDITKNIDLNEYLPEGVSVSGDSDIDIAIKIDKLQTKTYDIGVSDISVLNLKKGKKVEFSSKKIKITLLGEADTLAGLDSSDFSLSIDLKDVGDGTTKVPVSVVVPDGAELVDDVSVKIEIKDK